jgi:phosphocarrier protein
MEQTGGDCCSIRKLVTICNKRGLHARAAAKLVKMASQYESEIRVAKNGSIVSGRSIMGLMMLAASTGSTIEIRAEGSDAQVAVSAIADLVENGFHEED